MNVSHLITIMFTLTFALKFVKPAVVYHTSIYHLLSNVYLSREKDVQGGGFEGNGGYLFRDEQLYNAAIPKAGAGFFLPLSIYSEAFCLKCHHINSQPGAYSSCSGMYCLLALDAFHFHNYVSS